MTTTNKLFWAQILLIFALSGLMGCGVKKKHLRTIAAVVAVGIAAKLIYDMVVEHRARKINDADKVLAKYRSTHKDLPEKPVLLAYESTIKPGSVISAGETVSIISAVEVVPGKKVKEVLVEEEIAIYDNEDPTKVLKSLVKPVNADSKSGGAFENEFTFTLPKGMPQGVYPIRTRVFVNGVPQQPVENKMQLVWYGSNDHSLQIAR